MSVWLPYLLGVGSGAISGVLAVVLVGRSAGKDAEKPSKVTALGWVVLGLGVITAILASSVTSWGGSDLLPWIVAAGVATLVSGVGAIVKKDRRWATWVGLVVGVVPMLFWVLFAASYALGGPSEQEYIAQATELADQYDFVALFPSDAKPRLGEGAEAKESADGVYMNYGSFEMLERPASGATQEDLIGRVSEGERPMNEMGTAIEAGGKITTPAVHGQPAAANEYSYAFPLGDPNGKKREAVVLAFEADGVDVRMMSGTPGTDETLSVEELVKIAETMRPAD